MQKKRVMNLATGEVTTVNLTKAERDEFTKRSSDHVAKLNQEATRKNQRNTRKNAIRAKIKTALNLTDNEVKHFAELMKDGGE